MLVRLFTYFVNPAGFEPAPHRLRAECAVPVTPRVHCILFHLQASVHLTCRLSSLPMNVTICLQFLATSLGVEYSFEWLCLVLGTQWIWWDSNP